MITAKIHIPYSIIGGGGGVSEVGGGGGGGVVKWGGGGGREVGGGGVLCNQAVECVESSGKMCLHVVCSTVSP